MALAYNIPQQHISPVDALWSLIISQPIAVRDELLNRLKSLSNDYKADENFPVMTVAEINARFDQIEHEVTEGNTLSSEEVHDNISKKCPWL